MLRYSLRRLLIAIPTLLIASLVMFLVISATGDPLSYLLAKDPAPPQSAIDAMRQQLGLDRPLLERYLSWLWGVLHGDFGPSLQNIDIGATLGTRMLVSMRLILVAMVFAVLIAIVVGVVSALRQYGVVDNALSLLVLGLLAVPSFWLAILAKNWAVSANEAIGHQVFYTIGDGPPDGEGSFLTTLGYLVLPAAVLILGLFPAWSRYTRASMIEVLNLDYIRLARAKGLSKRRVVVHHGLRTALIPLVTVVAVDFGALIGGSLVIETVFQWRGMGDLLITSINALDVNAVLAWFLVFASARVALNLVADLLYAVLDPRVRSGMEPHA
jgi:peptide/nickel transport system permease protein